MKSSLEQGGAFSRAQLIDPWQCEDLVDRLIQLPEHFWYPGGVRAGAPSFSWLDSRSLPLGLFDLVVSLAPRAPSWLPRGQQIRRYLSGQSATLGSHNTHSAIVVQVPLQTGAGGILVSGCMYPDEAGVGSIAYDVGPILEVPPAVATRYEVIYLYDEI